VPTRNVVLTDNQEQLIQSLVESGRYQNASEVIREGLRLLKERDQQLDALRRDVRAGFEAVDRGEYTDYDEGTVKKLAERVKARGRRRLAEEEIKSAG